MLTISVRGLPRQMTEQNLSELFATHGRVHGLKMARDLFSGECKGFAELQMEGHEARAALAALNGSSHNNEMIRVGL
jgi:RNA recognition motif-containing protein